VSSCLFQLAIIPSWHLCFLLFLIAFRLKSFVYFILFNSFIFFFVQRHFTHFKVLIIALFVFGHMFSSRFTNTTRVKYNFDTNSKIIRLLHNKPRANRQVSWRTTGSTGHNTLCRWPSRLLTSHRAVKHEVTSATGRSFPNWSIILLLCKYVFMFCTKLLTINLFGTR